MRVLLKVLIRPEHIGHRRGRKERRLRHVDAVEPGGRDANDRDVASVQDDRLLEDLRIAGEGVLPERVTQDDDGLARPSVPQLAGVKPVPIAGDTPSTSK